MAQKTPAVTTYRDRVRSLLLNRPRTLTISMIAKGTSLSPRWIQYFAEGHAENPGVCYVEELETFLLNWARDYMTSEQKTTNVQ